jgi:hypothetical protein
MNDEEIVRLWSRPRCDHPRGCDATNVRPQFTRSLRRIVKGERQPRWFCRRHSARYKRLDVWGHEYAGPWAKEVNSA